MQWLMDHAVPRFRPISRGRSMKGKVEKQIRRDERAKPNTKQRAMYREKDEERRGGVA